jgi:hypothetical protein
MIWRFVRTVFRSFLADANLGVVGEERLKHPYSLGWSSTTLLLKNELVPRFHSRLPLPNLGF